MGTTGIILDRIGVTKVHTFGGPYRALRIEGGLGNDTISGAGSESTGAPATRELDIDAGGGRDIVVGGQGDDVIRGGVGNDDLTGGGGRDFVYGDNNDDILRTADLLNDSRVDGGPGADTAYFDESLDTPIAVETLYPQSTPPPPPPPPAGPCTYDAATKTLTAVIPPGFEGILARLSNGAFAFALSPSAPEPCPGTAATTEKIIVRGSPGSHERLALDTTGGAFWGGSDEPGTDYTLVAVDLGDEGVDNVVFTNLSRPFNLGENGLALDDDGDLEFTFAHRYAIEIDGGNATSIVTPPTFSAAGSATAGTGAPWQAPVLISAADNGSVIYGGAGADTLVGSELRDEIHGGAGNDTIRGGGNVDEIRGGDGDDTIRGERGDDALYGDAGVDSLFGGEEDDSLDAREPTGGADAVIDGGTGTDTAYVDPADPGAIAVETVVVETPPPPGPCLLDPIAGRLTVSLPAGGSAVLDVVGNQIRVDGAPCQGTTTTVDTIRVEGVSGSAETLTVDLRGGRFVPGRTDESVVKEEGEISTSPESEIEIVVDLGDDAGDTVRIYGTDGDDTITAGSRGASFDATLELDLKSEWAFGAPALTYEMHGLGGRNVLSVTGGGPLAAGGIVGRLFAGDLGDTLRGGPLADELRGGNGADTIDGVDGNDVLFGGAGADRLTAGSGNDSLTGGAGADILIGNDGDDMFRADDDENDPTISGGSGVDTAYYDEGIDPKPAAVEVRIPA